MFSSTENLSRETVRDIPLKVLAHLGDAVFHLFERERQVLMIKTASSLHKTTAASVSAVRQADLLDNLAPGLSEEEADIVRRARNIKPSNYRKSGQDAYRKATAFEALVGYLYLLDKKRLLTLLNKTLEF